MTVVGKSMVQTSFVWIPMLFLVVVPPRLFSLDSPPTKPRVSVAPVLNSTGQDNFDADAKIVFDTVEQTLRQGNFFQTVEWTGNAPDLADTERLASSARTRSLDDIVLIRLEGAATDGPGNSVICRVSVFDGSKGKVTIDISSGPVRLRGFLDASARTVSSALSALTGAPVRFGAIDLINTGEHGAYEILLDGKVVPEEPLAIVPSGSHNLVVRQKRLLGDLVLANTNLLVKEGKKTKVTISIPYLTPEEQTKVDELMRAVEKLWTDPNAGAKMDKALAAQEAFFDDTRCSPRLAIVRKAAEDQTSEWPAQQENLRKAAAESAASRLSLASLGLQRKALTEQKQSNETKNSWVRWTGLGGWVAAGIGAGIVGVSWLTGSAALNSYNSSTTQSGWDNARAQMNTANLLLSIGLSVGVTGLAVGGASWFLESDDFKIDKQLQEVDQKISLLGGGK